MSTPIVKDEARWWLGSLAVIKATAADTGNNLSVIDVTEPAGGETRMYIQHNEDQGFHVLEGSVTFEIDGQEVVADAGDLAWAPRGVPRRFTVGPDGARMLFLCTPGGFEEFVRETSDPADALELPPPDEPDYERVTRVAEAYGCEML